jgi:hypothetical protein
LFLVEDEGFPRFVSLRRGKGFLFSLMLCLFAARDGWSAAPTLTSLFPAGGQRGSKITVTCTGSFTWPVKVWAPGIEVIPTADSGKVEITIPADLAADRVWIRLYNEEGASVIQPFLIGGLKELQEVEPNDKLREAQDISESHVTVNGTLKSAEVDCFKVSLRAGQTLVAAVDANTRLGSPMDAILQIVSPEGIVLAENHDDLKLDPRLPFTSKTDGQYIVRVFAFPSAPDTTIRFSGSANHIYRLTLTTGPFVTHVVPLSAPLVDPGLVTAVGWNVPADMKLNVFPFGGSRLSGDQEFEVLDELRRLPDARLGFAFAVDSSPGCRVRLTPHPAILRPADHAPDRPMTLPIPSSVTSCLKTRRQADDYVIQLVKGQHIVISAEARSLNLALDPMLKLTDPTGGVISDVDDTGPTRDSVIAHTAAKDGDYRLTVSDRFRQGGDRCWYLLTVRLDEPDIELSVTTDSLVVPADKPAELTIKVQRRGKAGEPVGQMTIQAIGLPDGVTTSSVISDPTGPTSTEVKLSLTSTGMPFSGPIRIVGRSDLPKKLERFARTPAKLDVSFETIWLTAIKAP